jgi:hypothetical protein
MCQYANVMIEKLYINKSAHPQINLVETDVESQSFQFMKQHVQ